MTSRILFVGDPHFTPNNKVETDCLTNEVLRIITENNISNVVVLGDTLDRHETVNTKVLHRVQIFFNTILSRARNLYVLIGNHDIPSNNLFMSDIHPFMSWSIEGLHVIDKAIIHNIDNVPFLMVPYIPPGRFKEAIGTVVGHYRAIICHQEFKGCSMGSIKSTSGDDMTGSPDIISGHIHDRQRIGHIYYPGTPYQTNMGENSDKSISVITFNDNDYDEERFELNIPKKITIDINAVDVPQWTIPNTTHRYRLIVHGTNTEFLSLSKSGVVSNLAKYGVKISYKEIKTTNTNNGTIRRERLNFHDVFMKKIGEMDNKSELVNIINIIYK